MKSFFEEIVCPEVPQEEDVFYVYCVSSPDSIGKQTFYIYWYNKDFNNYRGQIFHTYLQGFIDRYVGECKKTVVIRQIYQDNNYLLVNDVYKKNICTKEID